MRASGILMGISSIPSKYGIGCFSKEAYDFVDQLTEGRTEILADSSSWTYRIWRFSVPVISTFAGNPYFIDLEVFVKAITDERRM